MLTAFLGDTTHIFHILQSAICPLFLDSQPAWAHSGRTHTKMVFGLVRYRSTGSCCQIFFNRIDKTIKNSLTTPCCWIHSVFKRFPFWSRVAKEQISVGTGAWEESDLKQNISYDGFYALRPKCLVMDFCHNLGLKNFCFYPLFQINP